MDHTYKKILVVYFSLDGNTEKIAKMICHKLNCTHLKLTPKSVFPQSKIIRFLMAGKQAVFKEAPSLASIELDLGQYPVLFLGTPVWAGNFSSPVRSFVKKYDISGKEIALFCTHKGQPVGALEKLEEYLAPRNVTILKKIDFSDPMHADETVLNEKVETYVNSVLETSAFLSQNSD